MKKLFDRIRKELTNYSFETKGWSFVLILTLILCTLLVRTLLLRTLLLRTRFLAHDQNGTVVAGVVAVVAGAVIQIVPFLGRDHHHTRGTPVHDVGLAGTTQPLRR